MGEGSPITSLNPSSFLKLTFSIFALVKARQHSTMPLRGVLVEMSFISNCIFVIDIILFSGLDGHNGGLTRMQGSVTTQLKNRTWSNVSSEKLLL